MTEAHAPKRSSAAAADGRRIDRTRRALVAGATSVSFLSAVMALEERRRVEARVLLDSSSASATEALQDLTRRVENLIPDTDLNRLLARPGPAIFVTCGVEALHRWLASGRESPLVSLFATRQAFDDATKGRDAVTGIFGEPSPHAQFRLIRALFKRRGTVATLLSKNTLHVRPLLQQAAHSAGLDLEVAVAESSPQVHRLLPGFDSALALLALPDPTVFSRESIRLILESTYRQQLPVIGFSAAMVRAGALASIFSTPQDVAEQAAWFIEEARLGRLPTATYPGNWRVSVNEAVANSFNLNVDDAVKTMRSTTIPTQR